MFPAKILRNNMQYNLVKKIFSESDLKELFIKYPYGVYAIVDEKLEESEPMLTTFLVLHSREFEERVILYDVSRQPHTTVTTELHFLAKGYIEFIDVGQVDRYPIRFYVKEEKQ